MRKIVIDWESAANNGVPCYFADKKEDLADKGGVDGAIVSRLIMTNSDDSNGEWFEFISDDSLGFNYCEMILESDKEKYTKIVCEGRDNFIKALKERIPMKVRVTPELSAELQEIALNNGVYWKLGQREVIHLDFIFIYFSHCIERGDSNVFFANDRSKEYFPETDSFEKPEPEYRACDSLEEFKPFWEKIAKAVGDEKYITLDMVSFEDDGDVDYWTAKYFFSNYTLLEPISGSRVIGVEVESNG